MLGLQELFESTIRERTAPGKILHQLISIHLEQLGLKLTCSQDAHLLRQCQELKDGSLTFEFDENQIIAAGYTKEEELGNILQEFFDDLPHKIDEFAEKLADSLQSAIEKSGDEISQIILAELKSNTLKVLQDQRALHQQFNKSHYKDWRDALDHLEMVIVSTVESGERYAQINGERASKVNDTAFDILCRLHARACLVSKEILLLLKHGYPDGAHARWRSLHEIVVVAALISEYGADLAERYMQHSAVESYKAALLHQEHAKASGYEPIDDDEMKQIASEYAALVERYGKDFRHEYGWASEALGIPKPSFADIEKSVNLSHYRPLYKLASHNVHANPKGAFFKLGLQGDDDFLLVGPSNLGLYEPGQNTARSLLQITASFVLREPTLDFIVVSKVLTKLVIETEAAFATVAAKQQA